jgi:hypothetical protein
VAITLGTECRMTVVGERSETAVDCSPVKFVGRRLIARLSEMVVPDAAVKFDVDDSIILGEAQGCWREGDAIFGAILLRETLSHRSPLLQDSLWPLEQPAAVQYIPKKTDPKTAEPGALPALTVG